MVCDGSAGKESACNAGDLGSIPGLGRSPGEGKGCPLQYSGLENSRDCVVHGSQRVRHRLSDFHFALVIFSYPMTVLKQRESEDQDGPGALRLTPQVWRAWRSLVDTLSRRLPLGSEPASCRETFAGGGGAGYSFGRAVKLVFFSFC